MTAKQKRILGKLDDPKFKAIEWQNQLIAAVCILLALCFAVLFVLAVKHYYDVQNCIHKPISGYWHAHQCGAVLEVE